MKGGTMPPEVDDVEVETDEVEYLDTGAEPEVVETEPEVEPETVDWTARITEWGGEDEVRQAVELSKSLTTKDGATDTFVSIGLALGLTPDQLVAIFEQDKAAGQPPPEEDEDLDLPLTKREMLELLEQQVHAPRQQEAQAEARQRVTETIDGMKAAGGTLEGLSDKEITLVLHLADEHLTKEEMLIPSKVRDAVEKGAEEFYAIKGVDRQKHVERKAVAHAKVPKPLSGQTGGGEAQPEAQNVTEGGERARKRLRELGVL